MTTEIIPLDKTCQGLYYAGVENTANEGTIMHAVEPGRWVMLERNCGLVVAEGPASDKRLVYVKWLPEPTQRERSPTSGRLRPAFERAFANVIPVLVEASALRAIEEPKLTREEAACYAALSPQRLYQLRDQGWFGGKNREPFYALPTELDAYAAAPKATNRWQSAEVKGQQEAYKSAGRRKKKSG